MVNALRDARHRLDEETEARVRIQSGLQRADKLITIGQLSAGLAHEIGSPLQVLSGRARLLVDHAGDPGTVHRNAMVLVSQADRIAGIVDQLLKHARQRPMAMGAIDLVSLARTVADFLALEARRRGITLHLSHGPDIPPLTGDGDRLQQVVLNLLTNAFRATPRGGQVTMSIEGSRDSGVVRLRVTDTGPGVAVEIHSRLFEPFFTTRAAEGGTGLGLAVVKAIVTDHGGSVSFSSRPGGGASFWVELPVPGAVRAATTA
jgi:signal transduction histidine kinase